MKINKIKDFKTKEWSGGETTELFIFPKDANYQDRDFLFRLSSASVKDSISTFTKLPGVDRKLLVLDGKLRLNHNKKQGEWLMPNDQESFSGGWHTVSEGMVIDYNLMLQEGTEGNVESIQLPGHDKENCIAYVNEHKKCFVFLYLWEGQIVITDGYEKKVVREKELVYFEVDNEMKVKGYVVENLLGTKARFVKTEVYLDVE